MMPIAEERVGSSNSEKADVSVSENLHSPTDSDTVSPLEYRKLIWKLDVRLLPPLFALWFVALLDRVNIGNARLVGLEKDLHMDPTGNQFNLALIVIMAGLITMEVPSNFLVKKISPSIILTGEVLLLGICTIGEGLVTNFAGLAAMRFLVGVFEAGLIPGSVFLLGSYYPRYEMQWRMSMLMVGNAVATAFGGLLAYAIDDIHSSNGYNDWRWIFIIQGCMTAGAAILAYPFMSDWPATAKWLTENEKAILSNRKIKEGLIARMDRWDARAIRRTVLDWKIYAWKVDPNFDLHGAMAAGTTVTIYSVAIFAPTIINQFSMGQDPRHVQALVIPIFIAASVGTLVVAYLSDHLKHRSGFAFFGYVLTAIGMLIMMNQQHVHTQVKYGALYFMAVGSYISLPMLWTMLVNNVMGVNKTGYAVAMQIGIGNVGGVVSGLVFKSSEAPLFATGYKTGFALTVMAAGLVCIYTLALWRENKARDAGKRDHLLAGKDGDNLGDDHPQFRYGY